MDWLGKPGRAPILDSSPLRWGLIMTSIGQCMLFEDNTEFNNQSAMLKILTGDEVVLAPYSPTDARLRGTISLRNELKDHYIVYKVPATHYVA